MRWECGDAVMTLLPERARVLQVSLRGREAFWTDPSATGWNVGGDRLWLAPEWAFFWTDLGSYDPATHRVQESMDPGTWEVVSAGDGELTVRQDVTLEHLHGGAGVRASVSRSFALVDPEPYAADVAYAVTARLDLHDPAPGTRIGLWSLVQVPRGGTAVIPGAPDPRDYFDPAPPGTWSRNGDALRIALGGDSLFKLGVAAARGVTGWSYERDGLTVERRFAVEPGATYADVPLSALDGNGDAVQVFCDGGRLGDFAEVEHHSPAATAERPSVVDESLTTLTWSR